ncbi:MAG: apolipoprotein N-acyltransferase [Spirochaeta sp. LUC14_002_19_P3]|nr:MAG: apolipoprotein N-acyltransferase [Spirochaeta sp. LUC14_002_19_P3]
MGLLLLGALLFALGFPNFIADWGWAPFAWICLVPVVLLIRRVPCWASPLWGAVYGYTAYALFNFWLATFNPVSFVLVPSIYAGWFFLLFPLLALVDRAFRHFGWLAQWLVWGAFEVVRTKGFLGYSYGIMGYSQYGWRSLIAIADIFGVMGVSLLVTFPSFLIGGWLLDRLAASPGGCKTLLHKGQPIPRRWKAGGIAFIAALLLANVYGLASRVNYKEAPRWRPALIQHNINTWLTGIEAWKNALNALLEESHLALEAKPDALVWSETAFVPSIEWHLKYRREREKVNLINTLNDFLVQQDIPVFIGNNDGTQNAGTRQDYNAVLLFDGDEIVKRYRKIHLVPFSEHFPYAKIFPRLMDYIQSQGTPLYLSGDEFTVFDLSPEGGPQVSPLICFEDTFGYLARGFVLEGAQVLMNVSNDSWSPEPACAIQHVSMAIFRSVENRRSLVRATTSGLTCVIDPNGKIIQQIDLFTQGHIIGNVPIFTGRDTLYTRWGDWFEMLILILAVPTIAAAGIPLLMQRKRSAKGHL